MQVTIFGVIWIVLALVAFSSSRLRFSIVFTMVSMTLQCDNVLVIAGEGIGPQLLASFLLLIKLFFLQLSKPIKVEKTVLFGGFGLIFVMIVSSLLNLGGFEFSIALRILQFFIYFGVFVFLRNTAAITSTNLKKIMIGFSYYLLGVGVLQVLITSGVLPRFQLVSLILYNDTSGGSIAYYTPNNYRICSTFMEPSYFAPVLCALIIYFFLDDHKSKHNYIILFLALIELVLTFSSTAYAALGLVYLAYIVLDRNKAHFKRNLVSLMVGFFAFLVLYTSTDIIQTTIFDKLDFTNSASGSVRHSWNELALDSFHQSELMGIGYKQSRASSLIFQLLGELGVFGFITYFLMIFGQTQYIFRRKSPMKIYSWMVLSAVVCQMIAVPDLDMCSTWLVMYVFAAAGGALQSRQFVSMRTNVSFGRQIVSGVKK